jgi:hypothetical protein
MKAEITIIRNSPTGELTEEQRLKRICELLSKAVVADWAGQITSSLPKNPPAPGVITPHADASDRQRILDYLALVGGPATPSHIRATLGLPRMRLYRAVQPMLASGRLRASGHTSTIAYSLVPGAGIDPERN